MSIVALYRHIVALYRHIQRCAFYCTLALNFVAANGKVELTYETKDIEQTFDLRLLQHH